MTDVPERQDDGSFRLLATAVAGMAVLHLAYGEAAPGWPALPAVLSGHATGDRLAALLALTATAALLHASTRRMGLVVIALYQAAWLLRGVPAALAAPAVLGSWYGFCEALAACCATASLALLGKRPASGARARGLRIARATFGLTCVFFGVSHFVYADVTAAMVPRALPGPRVIAKITGLCHVAAGLAIAAHRAPRLAATLEAIMMSLFGLLVWVPAFFADPTPRWATPPATRWSELMITVALATAAWIIAGSFASGDEPERRHAGS